ncbi:MAG: hypothetical protein K6G80_10045 [Treponema sp.]|nr:hypothetical protein [Treponema sp.]
MGERSRVDLSNLSGGAANDYFADAMKKVLANIEDINTPAKAVRGITLTLKIKPSEDRLTAETEINVSTKLAAVKPHSKSMFFSRDENGELGAFEENVKQEILPFEALAFEAAKV